MRTDRVALPLLREAPRSNYYNETKYCPRCNDYVRYLQSLVASYCVQCGGKVHLFSKKDHALFLRSLETHKPPFRRGRKRGATPRKRKHAPHPTPALAPSAV